MHVTRFFACAVSALVAGSVANADSKTIGVHTANWGWMDHDNSGGATVELIFEQTFPLPALQSIDRVMFELAHPVLSDLHLTLTSPSGDEFILARGRALNTPAPYNALPDGGSLGANPGAAGNLDDVLPYLFTENGQLWNDNDNNTDPASGVDSESVIWFNSAYAAGGWTIRVEDAWDTIAAGAIGSIRVEYTIPAPGSIALLAAAPLALMRRRRR